MLTKSQINAGSDKAKSFNLKSRDGNVNSVALVESSSQDGSYVIREAAVGAQGEFRLYCSCPAQRRYGYGVGLCKHTKALLRNAKLMIDAGQAKLGGVEILQPAPVERALKVAWAVKAAHASAKSERVA